MLDNCVSNISDDLKSSLATLHDLCEKIDSPRSLAISLMLKAGEWGEYLDLPFHHEYYEEPEDHLRDYLVTEMLRKHQDIPTGVDLRQKAMDSFWESEAQCARTNERLDSMEWPAFTHRFTRKIQSILGPLVSDDIQYIESRMGHGPGATTGVNGMGSVSSDKYDKTLHLTLELLPFYKSIIGEQWWEHHRQPAEIVEGSKFTTVPKSAKTDRGICIEPTLNMFLQKGIGACIRKKLRKFGINLDRQADVNRKLASRAHIDDLCTIDLSAASDSLASKLVHHFFPERWYHLLWIARSHYTHIDGNLHELEKWSSMGNGYTFELETLVFYALCACFVPKDELHNVSVFGDDIIIPRQYAQAVIEALNFFGFKVNQSKSYLAGNFFESCGHDYFKGHYVRPFYLKGEKDGIPFSIRTANKLRIYSSKILDGWACDDFFKETWESLVESVPPRWKLYVPESLGDTGLISSLDEAEPYIKKPNGEIEGYVVRHMRMTPKYKRKRTLGVLLANLAQFERRPHIDFWEFVCENTLSKKSSAVPSKGREPRRGYLGRPRPKKTVVSRWSMGLCWVSLDSI